MLLDFGVAGEALPSVGELSGRVLGYSLRAIRLASRCRSVLAVISTFDPDSYESDRGRSSE